MSAGSIVLVHAGICDNRMWDAFEPLLDDGRAVHRHEMRGFGRTPLPREPFSHAEDLEAALRRLDPPAVLVGASFGGLVALEAAARTPELVGALVLLDAALPDHARLDDRLRRRGGATARGGRRRRAGGAEPGVLALGRVARCAIRSPR
jgi:pimeloyl-ACP methyl ester carboxylesterase